MTPKEKASELVDKFKPMMYCFVGSEMLTNSFNEQEQLRNAKECAIIVVKEIDRIIVKSTTKEDPYANLFAEEYWQEVIKEINKL
jgi:hypothetical protein